MPPVIHDRAVLILVDVQPDFMPGGTLACHEGDAIVPGIDRLLRAGAFRHVVATQDWHPRGHVSFASSHTGMAPFQQIELYGHTQTLWPEHCVQDTTGARLHAGIDWSSTNAIIRKGSDPRVDSYSGFRETMVRMARDRRLGWPAGYANAGWMKSMSADSHAMSACCGPRKML